MEDESDLFRQARAEAGEQAEAFVSVALSRVALEGGYMVAVDGQLTPELAEEGLARELVHRIQNMRRSANFEVTDRIVTFYQAPDDFARVLEGAFSGYIRAEDPQRPVGERGPG